MGEGVFLTTTGHLENSVDEAEFSRYIDPVGSFSTI